ncbi:MAG TPA: MotA/TolQ/ExbB proton channel family protein [Ramlibacter sp.]|uniref:MotA/TolQ/ExbB proton channel family protein n=1 Tax=Ramlibacter sp. TaxID=1917967 RepID=UPI002D7ED069|nr:MotA/TolQ/ExbB proton channel family protein [Ramlibacter sp.]HET8744396.1 MotA/TolQ/ExbB proton channel family protein [Ramlibacter sp.]
MHPHFGLVNVWSEGDLVTRGVFLLLGGMSLASWAVIAVKALDQRRCARQAKAVDRFWSAPDLASGLNELGPDEENPFRALALEGRDASAHLGQGDARARLQDGMDASDWVTRCLRNAIDDCTAQLQAGLAILASVGSTAPFVGLFGTVWGIYHALMSIGVAGQATIDKVAGPIGEALIMTALGLAVAIPAVLGYNALVRGNKAVLHKLNRFAHDLHAYFVTGARVAASERRVVQLKKA